MRNEKYFLLLIAILIAQSVFADYPVLRDLQSRRLEHKDL